MRWNDFEPLNVYFTFANVWFSIKAFVVVVLGICLLALISVWAV